MGRFSRGILSGVSKTTLWLWRQFALHEASCQLARVPRNTPICRVTLHKPCNLAGKAHSVTGCRITLRKPCNLVSKAHSVTGCRPIKRQSPTASYVSELPTKFVFTFFAWLVVFVKKVLALWKKVW